MAVEYDESESRIPSMFTVRRAMEEGCEGIWRVHTRAIIEIANSHYTAEEIEARAGPREPGHYVGSIRYKESYVAEEDGAISGFGTLSQGQCEIETVYVSPEVVRRGVGKAILQKLEGRAKDLGIKSLEMDASLNAVPFYRRAGYGSQKEMRHRLASSVEIGAFL